MRAIWHCVAGKETKINMHINFTIRADAADVANTFQNHTKIHSENHMRKAVREKSNNKKK